MISEWLIQISVLSVSASHCFCFRRCAPSVPPGSLECLPREELEQRLRSSMMIVEALVQQLAASRAGCPSAGPAPSDLREKIVQTDHTELSQVRTHSDILRG